jgi:tetratricopeptide (TPR) repeat protein
MRHGISWSVWFGGALASIVLVVGSADAMAADNVKLLKGSVLGTITEITPTEVTIERSGGRTEKLAVNEIESIRFDGEPAQMLQVRNAAAAGRNEDAIKFLDKINVDEASDNLKADIAYYRALATGRLALGGTGSIQDAGKLMIAFIRDYPKSYHFLPANELVGDLLVGAAQFDAAEKYYKTVEETSPWPDFKMRAGVAKGRTLLKQAKAAEALKVFDQVLETAKSAEGDLVARQRLAAQVGKAECLAATGQFDEGVTLIQGLIGEADPEQTELHALAYNALGNCHRKAGRPKEARQAFLHVHILYSGFPETHAEALANLADLWKELGDPQRANEAQETLQTRYGNSKWAKGI